MTIALGVFLGAACRVPEPQGPCLSDRECHADRICHEGRCRFLGYRRDMAHWYGLFDAFLLTSENEVINRPIMGTTIIATISATLGKIHR